jgi:hypothetical protein
MAEQIGFDLGEPAAPTAEMFDPAMIRREALAIIGEARSVTADGPWDAATLKYKRILFPHLVSWLPDADERDQLCFDFSQEAARIELLLAA